MKKNFKRVSAVMLSTALAFSSASVSIPQLSLFNNESVAEAASVTHVSSSPNRVSVHDPSITKSSDGTYYVYGSHTAAAKSTDLVNWTKLSNDLNAGDSSTATNNFVFGNLSTNLKNLLSGPAIMMQMQHTIIYGLLMFFGILIMITATEPKVLI